MTQKNFYTFFYKQPAYKQLALETYLFNATFRADFTKQQYKIPDIPKMFSKCSAVFY